MQPWHIVGVFCEDVRQEAQTHSLIGILPDNVNVGSIPGMFPKLGIYIRFNISISAEVGTITLKIRFADGVELDLPSIEADTVKKTQKEAADKGTPWAGIFASAIASPLPIQAPGRIQVVATINGEEMICAAINVQLDPSLPTTALQQPSGLSPTAAA